MNEYRESLSNLGNGWEGGLLITQNVYWKNTTTKKFAIPKRQMAWISLRINLYM